MQFWDRGTRVQFLERHLEITQAFVPVGGHAVVMVVARPDAPEQDGLPAVSEIRAFVIPGDVAVQLHRGTWGDASGAGRRARRPSRAAGASA